MSEKVGTNSEVALKLFFAYAHNLDSIEHDELFADEKKLLKTFANFIFVVENPESLQDISK